jgi:hypothetical protein
LPVLTQAPPHIVRPPGQPVVEHAPSTHAEPGPQLLPQLPQLP